MLTNDTKEYRCKCGADIKQVISFCATKKVINNYLDSIQIQFRCGFTSHLYVDGVLGGNLNSFHMLNIPITEDYKKIRNAFDLFPCINEPAVQPFVEAFNELVKLAYIPGGI